MFTPKPRLPFDSENYYWDPNTNQKFPFPSIFDKPTIQLSFIVPAFNEEERFIFLILKKKKILFKYFNFSSKSNNCLLDSLQPLIKN